MVGRREAEAPVSGLSRFFVALGVVRFHLCRSCSPFSELLFSKTARAPQICLSAPLKSNWLRVTDIWTQSPGERWTRQGVTEDLTSPHPFTQAPRPQVFWTLYLSPN